MQTCLNNSITQFVQYKQKNVESFLNNNNNQKNYTQQTNEENLTPISSKFKYRYNKSNNKFRYQSQMNKTTTKVSRSMISNLALKDVAQEYNEQKIIDESIKENQNLKQIQKQLKGNSFNRSLNCLNGYLLPVQKRFLPIFNKKRINPIKLKELYMIRKKQDKMFNLIQKQQKQIVNRNNFVKRDKQRYQSQIQMRKRSMTETTENSKAKMQSFTKIQRSFTNKSYYNKQNDDLPLINLKSSQVIKKRKMKNFSYLNLHDKVRQSLQYMQMSSLKQNKSYELNMIQLR